MKCNNCDSEEFDRFIETKCFLTNEPLHVVKCKICSLVFLHPRPDKSLGLLYFENAYSNAKGFESHSYYRDHEEIFKRNRIRFERIQALCPPNRQVLDFGAGQGHFVKVVVDGGWNASGVELSEAAIEAARLNFNLILSSSLQSMTKRSFGVIALWDVIEHLENPKEMLLELTEYLHPQGYFVIETSNIDSLNFLLHRKKWSYWHVDHFYYYSIKTLTNLLNRIGFSVVPDSPTPSAYNLKSNKKIADYLSLLRLQNLVNAVRKRIILSENKNISRSSLMTIAFKRNSFL